MEPIPIATLVKDYMSRVTIVSDDPPQKHTVPFRRMQGCPLIEAVNKRYSPKTIRPATVKNTNIRTKKGIWK